MLRFLTNLFVSEELTNENFIEMVFSWLNGSPHYSFKDLDWNKGNNYFKKSSKKGTGKRVHTEGQSGVRILPVSYR